MRPLQGLGSMHAASARRSLHVHVGCVLVWRFGLQRLSLVEISIGVLGHSSPCGVCVALSLCLASTCVPVERDDGDSGGAGSSSSICVDLTLVFCRTCTPLCTLAGVLGGVLANGENGGGGLHRGEVRLRIRMSHSAKNSLGGRVSDGGDSWIRTSLHSAVVSVVVRHSLQAKKSS